MLDYGFWRDLRDEFRSTVDCPEGLLADWISTAWNEVGDQWVIANGDRRLNDLFRYLAERAAIGLGHSGKDNGLQFWLDQLKREGRNYRDTYEGWHADAAGNKTENRCGSIDHLLGGSADYCEKLMNEALKSSLEARALDASGAGLSETTVAPVPAPAAFRTESVRSPAAATLQPGTPSAGLRRYRRDLMRTYCRKNDCKMAQAARMLGTTTTALYGMIRGDRKRYSADTLTRVLKKVGISIEQWEGDDLQPGLLLTPQCH